MKKLIATALAALTLAGSAQADWTKQVLVDEMTDMKVFFLSSDPVSGYTFNYSCFGVDGEVYTHVFMDIPTTANMVDWVLIRFDEQLVDKMVPDNGQSFTDRFIRVGAAELYRKALLTDERIRVKLRYKDVVEFPADGFGDQLGDMLLECAGSGGPNV